MNILKNNPVGIDILINKMQVYFYSKLSSTFTGWESNHRCYRNPKSQTNDTSFIPEVYTSNGEYKEVFTDDGLKMLSFFDVDTSREKDNESGLYLANISLIVQTDLIEALPLIAHRADEELVNEFIKAIHKSPWSKYMTNVVTGVNDVYDQFDRTQITFNDMGRFHAVRFDFIGISYNPLECCNNC